MQFSSQTQKEIYAAKKILYEGDDQTKRTFIVVLTTLLALLILLILSLMGTTDQWVCEIDSADPQHNYICLELRKTINCRSLSGPIRGEVMLNIQNEVKASALAICPWEIAMSELRLCFVLLSILSVMIGLYSIRKDSKAYINIHVQSAIFLGFLLIISSYFDNMADQFALSEDVSGELLDCTYNYYQATTICSLLSGILLLSSSY